ncbi:hypothetical protein ASC63_07120 [Leifsonia sp. Root112D2]|nr:hypothetical protein ASC63_07120 [Leifsonia sp. Root112D2]
MVGVDQVRSNVEGFALDAKEVSKLISILRYRLNEQVREANRKNPIFSTSQADAQAEAQAKAHASLRVLREFASSSL